MLYAYRISIYTAVELVHAAIKYLKLKTKTGVGACSHASPQTGCGDEAFPRLGGNTVGYLSLYLFFVFVLVFVLVFVYVLRIAFVIVLYCICICGDEAFPRLGRGRRHGGVFTIHHLTICHP